MDPHDYIAWKGSGVAGALKAFWAAVKAATCYQYGIQKVSLTGIAPFLLTHLCAGFNIAENGSFLPHFSEVCGLTTDGVKDAVGLLYGADEEKAQKHLEKLEEYTYGYRFSNTESVPKVFNPAIVMWYLEVIFLKQLV